jgi:hypothetical protein
VLPNPSLKRSDNGRPQEPIWRPDVVARLARTFNPAQQPRHRPLTASLPNLPPLLSAYPRQVASGNFQPQPFMPPLTQLVKPNSRLVPFPLGSSLESVAHQNGAPDPHP